MIMIRIVVLMLSTITIAFAEAPISSIPPIQSIPSSLPSTSYGIPRGIPGSYTSPTRSFSVSNIQFTPPSITGQLSKGSKIRSPQYGVPKVPSTSYIEPTRNVIGSPIPSMSYGIPSTSYIEPTRNVVGSPFLSRSYGIPSTGYIEPTRNVVGAPVPSRSYGIPRTSYIEPTRNVNATSTSSYNVPSAVYGAPGAVNVPSAALYGAPYTERQIPARYEFEYRVQDEESGNDFGHQEKREGNVAQGRYFVLLPDGRLQIVEYTADEGGYKPRISYQQVGGYQYDRGYQY